MKLCNSLPKISIVTPSFNQGQYLEGTIQSVLNQNYPNLEYIIIDGGSTDNSVEIIKKYERYLAYWISEKDRGQTHAINKGFERSTGDILAYLNSDDLYLPDTFENILLYFQNNPDCKFLYGNVDIIDENGKNLKSKKQLPFDYTMACIIGFGLVIDQASTFWHREVYNTIGPFNEECTYVMDGDYWFRVSKKFRMFHINKYLAKLRLHRQSKTVKNKYKPDKQFLYETDKFLNNTYKSLRISHIIPYKKSAFIRKVYRIERILKRLILGHYFTQYKTIQNLSNTKLV